MTHHLFTTSAALMALSTMLAWSTTSAVADTSSAEVNSEVASTQRSKTVYIPEAFKNEPALKAWSWDRSYQSENFVVFWGPRSGLKPAEHADPSLRFDPEKITGYLEDCYVKYIDEFDFVCEAADTNLGKYKIIVVMNDTWEGRGAPQGYAFGAQYDDTIGAMWVHPDATRDGRALAHEFAHTLQSMVHIEEGTPGSAFVGTELSGFFWETHAQFMMMQMFPERAGTDLPRWMATSMYRWGSTRHHYANFHLLWHMQHVDGMDTITRIWHEAKPGEHPLEVYKRIKGVDQPELNDFFFDNAKRQVACDYPVNGFGKIMKAERDRLAKDEPHMLWRLWTILDEVDASTGHYAVPESFAPQSYGFNMIPLHQTGKRIRVKFKGHTEAVENAGWRYGFVVLNAEGGVARYTEPGREDAAVLSIDLEEGEKSLYLVVTGAPTQHKSYVWEPGWPKTDRYPYEIRIEGAVPEGHQTDFRSRHKAAGAAHPNGGGWVADTAKVADLAYVGPRAIVLGNSVVEGEVQVDGTAWVQDAKLSGRVRVDGNALVGRVELGGDVVVTDNAVLSHVKAKGDALFKQNALLWGGEFSGGLVVGGDAEIPGADSGVYLQTPHPNNGRRVGDGHGADHPSNVDVVKKVEPFTSSQMAFPE